ncbi:hypothetical protein Lesp02_23810 [Lentzea sp. NBRC 105346]|uniref:WXG100 family type VII secretion target n=1 Tax=Lentzea sp. NBRC 105346 TaxID=3032205 RepID=UPI0024A0035A|nr:WXG100 family type VII secretion target [Lentzea sp. NBRC 105346]GLZ30191.1 hypothetical protein Lesp02_23810 [Lentzea sp. NBRC 105346]
MAHNTPRVPPPNAHYPGQSHAAMNQQVSQNNDPGAAGEIAAEWKAIASDLTEVAVGLNTVVNGLSAGWTGQAGTAARQALTKVGNFTDKMSETFTSTGNSIQSQADAAEKAKNSFPKEEPYDPKAMLKDAATSMNPFKMATLPFDMMEQRDKSQAAKAEAERVMQERDNSMAAAAAQMPTFEDTPQVTNQQQGTTQASSTTYGTTTSSVNSNQPFTGMPPGTGDNSTRPSWTAPPVTPPSTPPGNPGIPPGNRPPVNQPGPFIPPGGRLNPNDPRNPMRGGPGGRPGMPGGPGGRGMGGPGGRGAGAFGPANPGAKAGGFGPANPGAGTGAHGPEGTAAGRGGTAGKQGAPGGMGGGGGHGQGAEDKEHRSTYLLPSDEYFDDDRMVAPPVIGG